MARLLAVSSLLVVSLMAAACAPAPSQPASPTTSGATDSTAVAAPSSSVATTQLDPVVEEGDRFPLTGEVMTAAVVRPALMVKIDNHDRARPQFGINAADVVYEEIVEGGLTRLAAVFHSGDADPVGPVRSVRTSDFAIVQSLGSPLFANSGGNAAVLRLLDEVDSVDVSSNAVGSVYYRYDGRSAPHNLVSDTSALWAAGSERGQGGWPPELFDFREADGALPAGAVAVRGVDIDFGGTQVTYEWQDDEGGWVRLQNGSAHVDADDEPVAPPNVIVQFISYGRSAADGRSPEAVLIGSGEAWVLTAGHLVAGTWTRDSIDELTRFVDGDGQPIELTPGATWVALARVGQVGLQG